MASTMTDKDCEDLTERVCKDSRFTMGECAIELMRLLPNEADEAYYVDWIERGIVTKLGGNVSGPQTSPAQFVDLIIGVKDTNFHDYKESRKLSMILLDNVVPSIPLGIDAETGHHYRLHPDAYGLRPQTFAVDAKEKRQVLPINYLGVNTNIQPRGPEVEPHYAEAQQAQPQGTHRGRERNYPEMSTQSAQSDTTAPGFSFYQIGRLQYYERKFYALKHPSYKENGEDEWIDTGFCVVGKLNKLGRVEDFYIIYEMSRICPEEGDRYKIEGKNWGVLPCGLEVPDAGRQFSIARMQPTSAFGDAERKVTWVDRIHRPVELVRCIKGSSDEPLRITVAEEKFDKAKFWESGYEVVRRILGTQSIPSSLDQS